MTLIGVLVAVRDFFVAVLIGWLGIGGEAADQTNKAEQAPAKTAQIAMIR